MVLSVTVLLAGLIVVFLVLVLLVGLVNLYGSVVSKAVNSSEAKKQAKLEAKKSTLKVETAEAKPQAGNAASTNSGIPGEVVAVIAAAVYTVTGNKNAKVRSIKQAKHERPVWGAAGVMDNTRPFV